MVKSTVRSDVASVTVICLFMAFLSSGQLEGSPIDAPSTTIGSNFALEPADPLPPTITTQPQSQVITSGTFVAFSVVASGTGPLSYLWQWNGTNIVDATNDTFSISNTLPSQAGSYQVIVTDAGLSVASMVASLTVLVPPKFIGPPQAFVMPTGGGFTQTPDIIIGTNVVMVVVASGTAPLSYQWRFNGTNIDGATFQTYSMPNISTNQSGGYNAVVSNAAGTVTSAVITLVVRAPMQIVTTNETVGFTNGAFVLRVVNIKQPPAILVVEASSNLVNWFRIYTNRSPEASESFMDFDAANHSQRFYRGAVADPLFRFGLTAKGAINLTGNNLRTDSFDSSDPNASTAGRYDLAKARDHGDIAAYLGVTNSVNVGNADIHGSVSTGPKGIVQIGYNGSVSGKITDDMNVAFPDVTIPFANGGYFTAPTRVNTNINGITYSGVFDGPSSFKVSSLSGTARILFTGAVSIWLPIGFNETGNGEIDLADGAKVAIYAGSTFSISGKGMINNGDSSRLIIYGLPGCTSINLAGNAPFTGCIYAPNADFNGRGDFTGACMTRSATLNGHFNFHFDENLQRVGPLR